MEHSEALRLSRDIALDGIARIIRDLGDEPDPEAIAWIASLITRSLIAAFVWPSSAPIISTSWPGTPSASGSMSAEGLTPKGRASRTIHSGGIFRSPRSRREICCPLVSAASAS
jgi:hypothetical protein